MRLMMFFLYFQYPVIIMFYQLSLSEHANIRIMFSSLSTWGFFLAYSFFWIPLTTFLVHFSGNLQHFSKTNLWPKEERNVYMEMPHNWALILSQISACYLVIYWLLSNSHIKHWAWYKKLARPENSWMHARRCSYKKPTQSYSILFYIITSLIRIHRAHIPRVLSFYQVFSLPFASYRF